MINSLIYLQYESTNANADHIKPFLCAEEGGNNYTEEFIRDGNNENFSEQEVFLITHTYDSVYITLEFNRCMFVLILHQCIM